MKDLQTRKRTIARAAIVASALFFALGAMLPGFSKKGLGLLAEAKPTPPKAKAKPSPAPKKAASKYSKFNHTTHTSLKIECDSCHKFPTANWPKVRDKESAFPDITDYPKHESCINCHKQQFFTGRPPAICSNCHLNPSPKDGARHPFANPRAAYDLSAKGKSASSAFEVFFPHDKHIEIVSKNRERAFPGKAGAIFQMAGMRRASEESCAVCHKTYMPQGDADTEYVSPPPKDLGDSFWLKKGTFKAGPADHATCFTCHSADTGIMPAPADCAGCHRPLQAAAKSDFDSLLADKAGISDKEMLLDWRRRDSSATFRHEFFSHNDQACASCHNAAAMDTTDPKTKKVKVSSCAPCHITAASDDGGILNFEIDSRKKDAKFQCVKCHLSFGRHEIPESHFKAIIEQGGK